MSIIFHLLTNPLPPIANAPTSIPILWFESLLRHLFYVEFVEHSPTPLLRIAQQDLPTIQQFQCALGLPTVRYQPIPLCCPKLHPVDHLRKRYPALLHMHFRGQWWCITPNPEVQSAMLQWLNEHYPDQPEDYPQVMVGQTQFAHPPPFRILNGEGLSVEVHVLPHRTWFHNMTIHTPEEFQFTQPVQYVAPFPPSEPRSPMPLANDELPTALCKQFHKGVWFAEAYIPREEGVGFSHTNHAFQLVSLTHTWLHLEGLVIPLHTPIQWVAEAIERQLGTTVCGFC